MPVARFLKQFATYFQNHRLKVFSILTAVALPVVFFFQNCARMSYDPEAQAVGVLSTSRDPADTTKSLGALAVVGVTGDTDSVKDNRLVNDKIPVFHWTESINATSYDVVVTQGSNVICQVANVTALTVRMSDCQLNNGSYVVTVTSYLGSDSRSSNPYPFIVEDAAVNLTIGTPVIDNKNVSIPYTVENPEYLSVLQCSLLNKTTGALLNKQECTSLRQMDYANLNYGDYIFRVTVLDNRGNQFEREREFSIVQPICNPLAIAPADDNCEKRLKANVFFHTSLDGLPEWNKADMYISQGIPAGTIYLSDIFIPTRSFTSGFPGISDRTEFFGMDIRARMKPSPEMPAGNYQMALLSDDGSIFYIVSSDGKSHIVVDHDYGHGTKLKCGTKAFAFTEEVNIRVKYFQGPRLSIALVLLYRPWNPDSTGKAPCPYPLESRDYFGPFPVPLDATSYPGSAFDKLLQDGWKVVPAESFALPL
ncbi:MAG: hypothetical protein AAGB31_09670 [Bdellovibrio sp.]